MDRRSNEIWKSENNFNNWELRKHRFEETMRPVFFQYLGITPDANMLDGGCGTGVFTRYLARGLNKGKITGFDISKYLVEFGNDRIVEEELSGVCKLIEADGFALPFAESTFDAVTNYTYLGVLSDPVAGLQEMIRVCRKGGTVSAAFPGARATWKGEYPFDSHDRLHELLMKQEEIYQKHILNTSTMYYQSVEWHSSRYPKMLHICGLKNIHIHSIASGFSHSDGRWPSEYREWLADIGIHDEIRIIADRSQIKDFEHYGFTQRDFAELIELLKKKREYLLQHLEDDRSFEWNAWMTMIVTGVK